MTPGVTEPRRLPPISRLWTLLAAAGAICFAAGVLMAPDRVWPVALLVSFAVVSAGLAGVFFVALQYATGACWATALRRVPEAMAALLPVGAVGMLLVLVLRPTLYSAVQIGEGLESTLAFKHAWLARPFLLTRAVVYLVTWLVFARAIVTTSRRQDQTGDPALSVRNTRLSVAFIVLFAATYSLACFDWIMALEPEWYSTIFAIYNFGGLFASGLAMIVLGCVWLEQHGSLHGSVTEEHLHDLGKLLFAFCTFWMYIWFSQYMLIWYANIPEESVYYVRRHEGAWITLFYLNPLLNWVVPFMVLLRRRAKRNGGTMVRVALVVLVGRALDLYVMILPPFLGSAPRLGVWEIGPILGAVGLSVLLFRRAFAGAAPVPEGDPSLQRSLDYHQ
jgi:hypothetical protein